MGHLIDQSKGLNDNVFSREDSFWVKENLYQEDAKIPLNRVQNEENITVNEKRLNNPETLTVFIHLSESDS